MDKNTLTKQLLASFTPFAWNCSCNGQHPDCARAMEDTRREVILLTRICDFILASE